MPIADPTEIANCTLWLAADNLVGFSDSDPVDTWPDESGNANDGTSSGSASPIYKTSQLNGLPVLRGDGSNTTMAVPIAADASASLFFVLKKAGAGADSFAYYGGSAALFVDAGSYAFYPTQAGVSSLGGTPTDWQIVELIFTDASSCTPYINGAAGTTFNPNGYDSETVLNLWGVGSDKGDYDIAEVILYSRPLTNGEREDVEDYLDGKYFGGGVTNATKLVGGLLTSPGIVNGALVA